MLKDHQEERPPKDQCTSRRRRRPRGRSIATPTTKHPTRTASWNSTNKGDKRTHSRVPTASPPATTLSISPAASKTKPTTKVKNVSTSFASTQTTTASSATKSRSTSRHCPPASVPIHLPTPSGLEMNTPYDLTTGVHTTKMHEYELVRDGACTVFVGQLPLTASYNEVVKLVSQMGEVKRVQMLTRSVKMKSGQTKQVFKGCVYVEYTTPTIALQATQCLHTMKYQSHELYAVSLNSTVPRVPIERPTDVLFLTNLPFHYSLDELQPHLHQSHAIFVKAKPALGYLFALYATKNEAVLAFQRFNGLKCSGRRIRVDFATQKQAVVIKRERLVAMANNKHRRGGGGGEKE